MDCRWYCFRRREGNWCINIILKGPSKISPMKSSQWLSQRLMKDSSNITVQEPFISHHSSRSQPVSYHKALLTSDPPSTPLPLQDFTLPLALLALLDVLPAFNAQVWYHSLLFPSFPPQFTTGTTLLRPERSLIVLLFIETHNPVYCWIVKDTNGGIRKVWIWALS